MVKRIQLQELSRADISTAFLTIVGAILIKIWYQTASIDELTWLVGPSVQLVEWSTGLQFDLVSGLGYLSLDRTILINKGCSGLNFLIILTTFSVLMRLTQADSLSAGANGWFWILPISFLISVLANATRIHLSIISVAFSSIYSSWITSASLHRAEGVFINMFFILSYFCFCNYLPKVFRKKEFDL